MKLCFCYCSNAGRNTDSVTELPIKKRIPAHKHQARFQQWRRNQLFKHAAKFNAWSRTSRIECLRWKNVTEIKKKTNTSRVAQQIGLSLQLNRVTAFVVLLFHSSSFYLAFPTFFSPKSTAEHCSLLPPLS
ncbi:hypothetical protein E2542_SST13353 [Spatholobus suberectus]|nr:hypothetical protein E2542_SST13353 [Spatholobus suberectus]